VTPTAEVERCPCGSTAVYAACCGAYIDRRAAPPTATALMRSRYTAYTLRDEAYLLQTWHASTRPARLDLAGAPAVQWLGLRLIDETAGAVDDDAGTVRFIARYRDAGQPRFLCEDSRFVREHGGWFYVDGVTGTPGAASGGTIGGKVPCPCGSGKKYKRCCGVVR
jgi:SEC-C motif-containing protein